MSENPSNQFNHYQTTPPKTNEKLSQRLFWEY